MTVDYNPAENTHTYAGAHAALSVLFPDRKPASLLDVGCGPGAWLRAAMDLGIQDAVGVDGLDLEAHRLFVPKSVIQVHDLERPFDLGRMFDLALCLEVAEHLSTEAADGLVRSITSHANLVLFGAACPGQPGQHHINCQWPAYWQSRFNEAGFACNDAARWQIWDDERIEPWYRQNMFWAQRAPLLAGREARINSVFHPEMVSAIGFDDFIKQIEMGSESISWYISTPLRALNAKLLRCILRVVEKRQR
jgi:SAM-dependent methyltransferase